MNSMDMWVGQGLPFNALKKIAKSSKVKTYSELRNVCSTLEDVEMWLNGEFEDEAFDVKVSDNPFDPIDQNWEEVMYNARCSMYEHSKIKSMFEAQIWYEKFKKLNVILVHTEKDDETSPTLLHAINGFLFYADDLMDEDEEDEMIHDICCALNLEV